MNKEISLPPCPWGRYQINLGKRIHELTTYEREWLAMAVLTCTHSYASIERKYGIKQGTTRKWVFKYNHNVRFSDGAGHPKRITSELKSEVDGMVKEGKLQKPKVEIVDYINKVLKVEHVEVFNKRELDFKPVSRRSVSRLEKEMDWFEGDGEKKLLQGRSPAVITELS